MTAPHSLSEGLDPPLISPPPLFFLSLNANNYDVLKLGYIPVNAKRLVDQHCYSLFRSAFSSPVINPLGYKPLLS